MTDHPPPAQPDHYRLLHVQPDAPAEVIKASWRTLLGRLRQHPDLGGSTAQAAALNQAWAVLGCAAQRAAYDAGLPQRAAEPVAGGWGWAKAVAQPLTQPLTQPMAGPMAGPMAQPTTEPLALLAGAATCPLCHRPVCARTQPDSRCPACHSPLARLPGTGPQGHELLGRRGAVRRDQSHVALVHVGWPSPALPVRWRDLSLTGLSFYAPQPIPAGQTLRLIDSAIEGVVQVVGCRAQGRVFTVHARLLTALLLQATGVFVSAQA